METLKVAVTYFTPWLRESRTHCRLTLLLRFLKDLRAQPDGPLVHGRGCVFCLGASKHKYEAITIFFSPWSFSFRHLDEAHLCRPHVATL